MRARTPDELDHLFVRAVNARDLESVVALYEPMAVFVTESGAVVTGTDAIREAFRMLLETAPVITELEVRTLAQAGDVAVTSARWSMTTRASGGEPQATAGQTFEVCRRQADGTWLFVIDSPRGIVWAR